MSGQWDQIVQGASARGREYVFTGLDIHLLDITFSFHFISINHQSAGARFYHLTSCFLSDLTVLHIKSTPERGVPAIGGVSVVRSYIR